MKRSQIYTLHLKTILFLFTILISNSILSQATFVESQNLPATFPTAAELVDLDNDGDLDLIRLMARHIGISDLNANEIWLNDGSGYYTLHQSFGNSESQGLAVGDLDNDGDKDIFIVNATNFIGPSSVSSNKVWFNDGLANFTSNGQSLGDSTSGAVALGDFDNDNDLDAYVANIGDGGNANKVWLNNGNGYFLESWQSLGNSDTNDVVSVDIDNDDDIDIITANCCYSINNNANVVWLNNGSGSFTNSQEIGDFWSHNLSIADLDGDSDIDVVFSNSYDESKAYVNDGSGNFSFHSNIITLADVIRKKIKFSDIDNDGDNDLVVGIFSPTTENKILINDGFGNFTEGFLFNTSSTMDVAIGDIDNDGDYDVFILSVNNENNIFWLNQNILSTDKSEETVVKIYPNPVKNTLHLTANQTISSVSIFNLLGQELLSVEPNLIIENINLSDFNPGMYLVKVKIGEHITSYNIIKQ